MAIFGWIVLFLITCYSWWATIAMFRVSIGFTGRVDGEVYFFFALSIILSGLVWWVFPFEVAIK